MAKIKEISIGSIPVPVISEHTVAGHTYYTCGFDSLTFTVLQYKSGLRVAAPDCTISDWLRLHAELHFLCDR